MYYSKTTLSILLCLLILTAVKTDHKETESLETTNQKNLSVIQEIQNDKKYNTKNNENVSVEQNQLSKGNESRTVTDKKSGDSLEKNYYAMFLDIGQRVQSPKIKKAEILESNVGHQVETNPKLLTHINPRPNLKITVRPGQAVTCPKGTHWNVQNSITRMGMCISDEIKYCSDYIQDTGVCVSCDDGYRLTPMGDAGVVCIYYSHCIWPYIGLGVVCFIALFGGFCWCKRGRRRNTGGGPYGGIPAGGQYGGMNDTGMGQGMREAIGMEDPTWETGMIGIGNEGYGDIR